MPTDDEWPTDRDDVDAWIKGKTAPTTDQPAATEERIGQTWEWRGTHPPRERWRVMGRDDDKYLIVGEGRARAVSARTLHAEFDLIDEDETPAQPTVGQCMRAAPTLFAEHRTSCVLPWGHRGAHTDGTAHWTLVVDGEPMECPDPSAHGARPAAEAGRADETRDLTDVWLATARAFNAELDDHLIFASDEALARTNALRDAVDAARAPLLAELDDLHGAARASYDTRMEYLAERDQARAELAEVTRERDEARAKAVDGGEWQWGVRWEYAEDKPVDWLSGDEETARAYVRGHGNRATLMRRFRGHPEVVGDDGSGT